MDWRGVTSSRKRPNIRKSAPKDQQHAKTLRRMLYTQKWGHLPKAGLLGLCGRTFGADLRTDSPSFQLEALY